MVAEVCSIKNASALGGHRGCVVWLNMVTPEGVIFAADSRHSRNEPLPWQGWPEHERGRPEGACGVPGYERVSRKRSGTGGNGWISCRLQYTVALSL